MSKIEHKCLSEHDGAEDGVRDGEGTSGTSDTSGTSGASGASGGGGSGATKKRPRTTTACEHHMGGGTGILRTLLVSSSSYTRRFCEELVATLRRWSNHQQRLEHVAEDIRVTMEPSTWWTLPLPSIKLTVHVEIKGTQWWPRSHILDIDVMDVLLLTPSSSSCSSSSSSSSTASSSSLCSSSSSTSSSTSFSSTTSTISKDSPISSTVSHRTFEHRLLAHVPNPTALAQIRAGRVLVAKDPANGYPCTRAFSSYKPPTLSSKLASGLHDPEGLVSVGGITEEELRGWIVDVGHYSDCHMTYIRGCLAFLLDLRGVVPHSVPTPSV